MTMPLFNPGQHDYDTLYQAFNWSLPSTFNIGVAVCDPQNAFADRVALYYENEAGVARQYTFRQLKRDAQRFANVLTALGIKRGDRVGIVLPQRYEAGLAHIAIYQLGAIALPLSVLFGEEALSYRLQDSGARLVVTDGEHRESLQALQPVLPDLATIIDCDGRKAQALSATCQSLWPLMEKASDTFVPVTTAPDDPAYLIYTSGTTGPPKGALGAHRCLLGNLTGFELSQNFFPRANDVFWTPADWAWTGGLFDGLLPSWFYGVPVVGYENRGFDAEKICHLLQRYRVTTGFVPPTALKMLRQLDNIDQYQLAFRAIMSAGETLGAEIYEWTRDRLGVEVNEMCGQTEFNYVVGNCSALMPVKPGSMGKAYPGHRVDPVDADGQPVPIGEIGELAARRDDPVMFLGYWNQPEATTAKHRGEYWGFGDLCYRDDEGYLWFKGRDDDIISTAGYRVGPGEVEDSLLRHPAVAQCAVIGVPDELRGQIVKAYVVLSDGQQASDQLASSIKNDVKQRLAAHEYPRELTFVKSLPMTATGKIRRVALRELSANDPRPTPDEPELPS